MSTANDRRIARNTVFLYARMLLTLGLSLYTSRVVLDMLGVRDYGVYNVVGGLITILAFLNGTMSGATQRFLNFEMGRGAQGRLKETFASAWFIHLAIGGILLVLGETVGLWFVNNYLVIEPSRMAAANWVYQFSLLGGIFTVITVPFTGSVFAHEDMNVYAGINILFAVLKLGVALLLLFVATADNLVAYGALMLGVQAVNLLCYGAYCLRRYPECSLKIRYYRNMVRAMLGFSGADLAGTFCYTAQSQGILVILNRFGGTVLNAAGGLTMTVNVSLSQFGSSLVIAFRPQIIQQYAARDYAYMERLMVNCSKYATLLLALFAIPAYIEMDYLLSLWLKVVPDYTATFCRLTLLMSLSNMAVLTLNAGIHATGRILGFSVLTGLSYLLELPVIYFLIKASGRPEWAYIVPIAQMAMLVWLVSWLLKRRLPEFRIWNFVSRGYLSPAIVALAVGAVSYLPTYFIGPGFVQLVATTAFSAAVLCASSWFLLLNRPMRREVLDAIKSKLRR